MTASAVRPASDARVRIVSHCVRSLYCSAKRDHRVGGRALEEPAAAGGDHDVLLAVASHVGRRNRMRRRVELLAPQLLAVARVERAEFAVDGRADEHQVAGRGDRPAETRRAGLEALRVELVERSQRHVPRDVAGLRADGDELAPRRRLAGVHRLRIPEAAAFRRHLAPGRVRRRVFVAAPGAGATPRRGARRRPPRRPRPPVAGSRCPHCPAFMTLVIISPSGLLTVTPFQLPPPTAPGKSTMSCLSFHGV